jgi:hypothetical protein
VENKDLNVGIDNKALDRPVKIKGKAGRPLGVKDGQPKGLSLRQRLRELRLTIKDPNTKQADKINAIKLMSELLGDKVKDNNENTETLLIAFEEIDSRTSEVLKPLQDTANLNNNMPKTKDLVAGQVETLEINEELKKNINKETVTNISRTKEIVVNTPKVEYSEVISKKDVILQANTEYMTSSLNISNRPANIDDSSTSSSTNRPVKNNLDGLLDDFSEDDLL